MTVSARINREDSHGPVLLLLGPLSLVFPSAFVDPDFKLLYPAT